MEDIAIIYILQYSAYEDAQECYSTNLSKELGKQYHRNVPTGLSTFLGKITRKPFVKPIKKIYEKRKTWIQDKAEIALAGNGGLHSSDRKCG